MPFEASKWIQAIPTTQGRIPIFRPPPVTAGERSAKRWKTYLCVYGSEIQTQNPESQPGADELVFRSTTATGHGSCTKLYDRKGRRTLFFPYGVTVPMGSLLIEHYGFPSPVHRFFEVRNAGMDVEITNIIGLPWVYPSSYASEEDRKNPEFFLPTAFEVPLINPLIVSEKQAYAPAGIMLGNHREWRMKDYMRRLPDEYYKLAEEKDEEMESPAEDRNEAEEDRQRSPSPVSSRRSRSPTKDRESPPWADRRSQSREDRPQWQSRSHSRRSYSSSRGRGRSPPRNYSSTSRSGWNASSYRPQRSRSRSVSLQRSRSPYRRRSPPRLHHSSRSPGQHSRRRTPPRRPESRVMGQRASFSDWEAALEKVEARHAESIHRRDQENEARYERFMRNTAIPLADSLANTSRNLADSLKSVMIIAGTALSGVAAASSMALPQIEAPAQAMIESTTPTPPPQTLLQRLALPDPQPVASSSSAPPPQRSRALIDRIGLPARATSNTGARKSKSAIARRQGPR